MTCKYKGIACKCELEGGPKADFVKYILDLWQQIGYNPNKQSNEIESQRVDILQQEGGNFTPMKTPSEVEKFAGVVTKIYQKIKTMVL